MKVRRLCIRFAEWIAMGLSVSACGGCPCKQITVIEEVAPEDLPPDATAPAEAVEEPAAPAADAVTPSEETSDTGEAPWWNIPYPSRFDATRLKNHPSFISVKGNKFVNEAGETVIFKGVNIADPDKIRREGHWDAALFDAVASWGANVVRIPVHPAAWRGLGRDKYFELLDQAVVWADERNLYLIIDWHSIGNLEKELFQHGMYVTTKQETFEFWRAVSYRYQDIPTAAFYDLFNEPTVYNGNLGTETWAEWKQLNEEIISIIYSHDKKVIPLVAGFNWAYDLSEIKKHPIEREGIAYVSHPYPQKVGAPYEKSWTRDFGYVAKKYPLFVTEIGYMRPDAPGAHIPVMDDGSYGKRITDYLDKIGASWTAWCFHPYWPPQLISDWEFTPTESGEYFKEVMLGEKEGPGKKDAVDKND